MKLGIAIIMGLMLISGALAVTIGPMTREQLADAGKDPVFYNELGYQLSQEGRMIEAQAAFQSAVDLDPVYENARKNLYVASFQNEDYLTATKHLRVLVELNPNDQYHFDLAQSLVAWARFQATDASEAIVALEEATEHLEIAGDFPNADENAKIVKKVLDEALA